MRSVMLIIIACCFIQACGQKGPLVMPQPDAEPANTAQKDTEKQ